MIFKERFWRLISILLENIFILYTQGNEFHEKEQHLKSSTITQIHELLTYTTSFPKRKETFISYNIFHSFNNPIWSSITRTKCWLYNNKKNLLNTWFLVFTNSNGHVTITPIYKWKINTLPHVDPITPARKLRKAPFCFLTLCFVFIGEGSKRRWWSLVPLFPRFPK